MMLTLTSFTHTSSIQRHRTRHGGPVTMPGLLYSLVLLTCLFTSTTHGAPYVSKHPKIPLGLKDADAIDTYNRRAGVSSISSIHKQLVEQSSNRFWQQEGGPDENSKHAASLLRPQPEDEYPLMPINVPASNGNPPGAVDLHSRKLRKLLGGHYDSRYLSEKEPLDHILRPNGTLVYKFEEGRPKGTMPPEFRRLSFNIPERRSAIRIKSKKTRRKVKDFLWAYSYCPVQFQWKDLGPTVWPRWIREGSCHNSRPSCSFPAGMTCQPSGKTDLHMLYWHCRSTKQCKWMKFQYSIISQCGCRC